jgi:lantibiotic transport system permease protein
MLTFIHSLQSEWMKTKRSLASWLVIIGAFFTPLVFIIVRLFKNDGLAELNANPKFWDIHWQNLWQSMATFLLPVGIILATSLVTQLEYKNNTWKQLHTLPLSMPSIFFSKLLVIVLMIVQFFILFNIGILLSAYVPAWFLSTIDAPVASIPWKAFGRENLLFFLDCLPIIVLQFLLSLQFKNFLASLGIGFGLWIAAVVAISWKHAVWLPYTYTIFNMFKNNTGEGRGFSPEMNIHWMATSYFILFTIAGYLLFINKKEKG